LEQNYHIRRSRARMAAVQALYQMDISGTPINTVIDEFTDFRFSGDDDKDNAVDTEFFSDLMNGVVEFQETIDKDIAEHLSEKWSLKRLDMTLRAIMRAACYEISRRPDIPALVIIDEYVAIATSFFEQSEPAFVLIARHFAPLAGPEGMGLLDDAAHYSPPEGYDLVLSMDGMVEGVPFPKGEYGADIAERLLRTNLSDIAAKAALPQGYLLSIAWPKTVGTEELVAFAEGLSNIQKQFGCMLWGGDSVATDGPLVITATLIGIRPQGKTVLRQGASAGRGFLGLMARMKPEKLPDISDDYRNNLRELYYKPEPRMELGELLLSYASASADVSDGLMADAAHIAKASGIAIDIKLDDLPFAEGTELWTADNDGLEKLLSGGDDYEILFTSSPDNREAIEALAKALPFGISHIGSCKKGQGVRLVDNDGETVPIKAKGYSHF